MNIKPTFVPIPAAVVLSLSPQALKLLRYMRAVGSVTQRDAILDLSIQSLTRRITELRGFYEITSDKRMHKATGQRYVRYFLKGLRPGVACEAIEMIPEAGWDESPRAPKKGYS